MGVARHKKGACRRRYTVQQRIMFVKCLLLCGLAIPKAVARLHSEWPTRWSTPPPYPEAIMQRWLKTFEETGSVADRPRPGRPKKLTDAKARAAAKIFKEGYEVVNFYNKRQTGIFERMYDTSINEACDREPRLQQYCDEFKITRQHLLQRMKQADPNLVRRRLDVREPLSPAQCKERQKQAQLWLKEYEKDGDAWLNRLVFLDESTFLVSDVKRRLPKVWCDAHDDNVRSVIHLENLLEKKDIKIRFYIAVSPKFGPLMIYPTTGTTNIVRRYPNVAPPPEDEDGEECFEVSVTHMGFCKSTAVCWCHLSPQLVTAGDASGTAACGCERARGACAVHRG